MQRNNVVENSAQLNYNIYEPFSIFKDWGARTWFENTRLFEPNAAIENVMNAVSYATFKNNWNASIYTGYNFGTTDYFEPRSSNNRYYLEPGHYVGEIDFNTDTNKKLSWYLNYGFYNTLEKDRWGDWINTNIWWKASARFNLFYDFSVRKEYNAKGFVDSFNDDNIFFGTYDRNTFENTFSMGYTFNTKLAVDFRARHYWSFADYEDQQYFLNLDGSLKADNHTSQNDVNFNAFNIDMVVRWEFAPGSELSLAWKNAIYHENELVNMKFGENLKETFASDQTNSVSLKILYYIDYNTLVKRKD